MISEEMLIRKGSTRHRRADLAIRSLFGGLTYLVVFVAILIFAKICWDGAPTLFSSKAPYLNLSFLMDKNETLHVFDTAQGERLQLAATEFMAYVKEKGEDSVYNHQSFSYSGGGIIGPIAGTLLLTTGSILIALFFGVSAAIYLSEYAKDSPFIRAVRVAILNLAGVPSIVFGLFGFSVFVLAVPIITEDPASRSLLAIPLPGTDYFFSFQGWNSSLLAGCATLACMILPVIITAAEEALKSVPQGFRDASSALGATRWQTIRTSVLPYSVPGILTSSLLAITRVAGETAPIMFTAAVAAKDELPWEGIRHPLEVLSSQVQALPYHIYTLAARIPNSEYTQRAQFGSVFVFLLLVAMMSFGSMYLRSKMRAKLQW